MNNSLFQNRSLSTALFRIRIQRGLAFGVIIITALLAFEIFNYSTTVFALTDLLGDLDFLGIRWATILAIAFCGIDFAGIARLFTPEEGADEPNEIWYLFGAWLLAATMNAMLTWWGVSIALLNHESLGNAVISRETLVRIVPIFVAVLVWLIRILIIGTFSIAGDRLFSQAERRQAASIGYRSTATRVQAQPRTPVTAPQPSSFSGRTNHPPSNNQGQVYTRPEPTYHPLSMTASPRRDGANQPRNYR